MYSEKPPVARKRAGGFSRLNGPFIGLLFSLLIVSPRASAVQVFSAGHELFPMFGDAEINGTSLSVINKLDSYNWGVQAGWLRIRALSPETTFIDFQGRLEKAGPLGTLVGGGAGFLMGWAIGPGFLGTADIYGKVKMISVGAGSIRGMLGYKILFGGGFSGLFHAGIEASWER